MLLADIARDASLAGEALVDPVAGAAGRGRPLTALGLAVVAAVAFAAVAAPRTDFAAAAALALDRSPKAAEMTPHDREEALALAAKLGRMRLWTDASLGTALAAAAVAGALWAAFRLAGARPAFRATFAVAAHGMLPGAVGRLLAIPAALAHAPLRPSDLGGRLPFSSSRRAPRRSSRRARPRRWWQRWGGSTSSRSGRSCSSPAEWRAPRARAGRARSRRRRSSGSATSGRSASRSRREDPR